MYVPVYNKATGLYGGLTKKLAHITLRGDDSGRFYSYGFSKEKSALLYCTHKDPLSNVFHCKAFKKHHGFHLDKNQKKAKFSKIFLYLPSTLNRKDNFLQWKDHVHLHPIDVSYDELKAINDGKMNPALLDHKELRKEVVDGYYKMMKTIAEVSNQNLVGNSDAYSSNGGHIDPDNKFSWIDDSYRQGKDKFQLSYSFLGSNFNIWHHLGEELQLRILLYLNAKDLITLCYVSKYFKKLVLKQFNKHYDISTGFCAVSFWAKKFEENVFKLIEAIHSELFDTFAFDFEENYDKLIKKFRHMLLFSVC